MSPHESLIARPGAGRRLPGSNLENAKLATGLLATARLATAGLALLLAACSHRPLSPAATPASSPTPSAAPADTQALRAQVRGFAITHCGTCHRATLATAKPAALAIYNLDAEDWSATLTAARLEGGFTRRLNARLNERDRELLRAFVANEVALRRK